MQFQRKDGAPQGKSVSKRMDQNLDANALPSVAGCIYDLINFIGKIGCSSRRNFAADTNNTDGPISAAGSGR
jgi:hypothetical protein